MKYAASVRLLGGPGRGPSRARRRAANGFRLSLRSAGMTAVAQSRRRDDALIHFFIATLRKSALAFAKKCSLAGGGKRGAGSVPLSKQYVAPSGRPASVLAPDRPRRHSRRQTSGLEPPFSAAGFFQGPDLGLVTRQRHRSAASPAPAPSLIPGAHQVPVRAMGRLWRVPRGRGQIRERFSRGFRQGIGGKRFFLWVRAYHHPFYPHPAPRRRVSVPAWIPNTPRSFLAHAVGNDEMHGRSRQLSMPGVASVSLRQQPVLHANETTPF